MSDRVFIDTNVFVYLYDESEPKKRKRARERLLREQARNELVVSTQVLQELFVALTRGADPIRLPEDAQRAVRSVAKLTVVQVDPPLIFGAISTSRQHQISFWDALLVESGLSVGCVTLLTEDLTHGQYFGELQVENPFIELEAAQSKRQTPENRPAPKRRPRPRTKLR